jgi:hypothetical protein
LYGVHIEEWLSHDLDRQPGGRRIRQAPGPVHVALAGGDLGVARGLLDPKVMTERWRRHYDAVRRHSSLGYGPSAPKTVLPWHSHYAAFRHRAAVALGQTVASFMGAGRSGLCEEAQARLEGPPKTFEVKSGG